MLPPQLLASDQHLRLANSHVLHGVYFGQQLGGGGKTAMYHLTCWVFIFQLCRLITNYTVASNNAFALEAEQPWPWS